MSRINLLPNWMLPDSIPSVYDTQSGSFQEMVAKVYGAMRELQLDYKSFVNEINKSITEFTESTDQDQEKFKEDIASSAGKIGKVKGGRSGASEIRRYKKQIAHK